MNGEVVDALLSLLSQDIKEELDVELLWSTADTLECLIDRYSSYWYGTVTYDLFTGFLDSFPCREVHQGVRTPLNGPTHLVDLFIDA